MVLSWYSYGTPVCSHVLPWWLPWWRLEVPGTLKVLPRYSYDTPMSLWKAIPVPCAGYWFASAGTWYSPSASAGEDHPTQGLVYHYVMVLVTGLHS